MKNNKGLTIIELLIAVVIIGIAFYALIKVFIVLAPRDVDARSLSVGTHLINRRIEEVTMKSFSNVSSESAAAFPAPFNAYTGQIIVDYVTTADVNSVSASPTPYKRVKARVWGTKLPTIEGVTLVVTYEVR
ncbi:MAG TPA: type II secretion system protein [Candidatus Omnitrophota bacterium]|nr:type II secretion system protein [Candidatus Omnitrophota bacterium]